MKIHSKSVLIKLFLILATAFAVLIFTLLSTSFFDTKPLMSPPGPETTYLNSAETLEDRVADLLSYMTLEEKIGQMALVEKNSLAEIKDIRTYSLGALLSGSGSKPEENTKSGWLKMIDNYQAEAAQSRLGIPLLYGSDAIHGHAHVSGNTIFPHSIGLGAAGNPELVRELAEATAIELAATGVNWNFAPNLDTPQDIRWGRVYETFSDDPQLVAELGTAYLKGLQEPYGENNESIYVLGTLKHFVGLGGMEWQTSLNKNFKIDQGVTQADTELLRSTYLPPFTEAINEGALSIMVGLNTWGDSRTIRQKELLTTLLKTELNFKGFVVSDWYGVHEGVQNKFFATVEAINAGVDMVMLPFDYKSFARDVKWANRLGLISDERIDDAVSRILYAKFALGLFDDKARSDEITSEVKNNHRDLARQAVSNSLVLLKNEAGLLPIKNNTRKIRVAGSSADNIGMQLGAWSVEWQGIDGNWLEGATSLLKGIENRAQQQGTKVEYDITGKFTDATDLADIGIAIVGEKPYAEGWGDKEFPALSKSDLETIKNLQASSEKIVVIIVSGRPLLITNEIDSLDALVAAWLPGSAGEGVADVLFGDKSFSGKLPLPWPAYTEQLPITPNGQTVNNTPVLFPRYFGLKF